MTGRTVSRQARRGHRALTGVYIAAAAGGLLLGGWPGAILIAAAAPMTVLHGRRAVRAVAV